jgi:hypothetical protein
MAELASLIIAGPPIIDLVIQQYDKTRILVKDIETAGASMKEALRTLEGFQMEFKSSQMWIDRLKQMLGTDFKEPPVLMDILHKLEDLAAILQKTVERMENSAKLAPLWFAMSTKKTVISAINEIDMKLQGHYRYLITVTASRAIPLDALPSPATEAPQSAAAAQIRALHGIIQDRVSKVSTLAPSPLLSLANTEAIEPRSTIRVPSGNVIEQYPQSERNCLIEFKTYTGSRMDRASTNVKSLTFALSQVDNDTMPGMLRCRGCFHNLDKQRYELQYDMPNGIDSPKVRTLRSMFRKDRPPAHPLHQRYRLANNIAKAILFIHCHSYVHKQIQPENILLFYPGQSDKNVMMGQLPKPFLLGFGAARSLEATSELVGTDEILHNLYRHPIRQGTQYLEKYTQLDDVYSFGVILLEVAMWGSLVETTRDGEKMLNKSGFEILDQTRWKSIKLESTPNSYPEAFLRMAEKWASITMGGRFVEVILTCLTCLESDPANRLASASYLWEANKKGPEQTREADEKRREQICLAFEEHVLIPLEELEQTVSGIQVG